MHNMMQKQVHNSIKKPLDMLACMHAHYGLYATCRSLLYSANTTVVCIKDGKASFLRFWKNHP